jgi:O-antigen/teichoic acid export membrane protein
MVLRFVRSVILARMLTPADFGVAATFALTTTFLELLSDLGMDKLLVQSKDEEVARLQETSHTFALVRGLMPAGVIFVLAGPIAAAFKTPEAAGAFRCLALVPLMRGFYNQDTIRMERELRFAPGVIAQIGGAVISTALAWPLCAYFRDYWALLWLLVIEAAVFLVFRHALSERRYRLGWDREEARRLGRFGWPLLLNGLLMFVVLQGDRVIIGIGRHYTTADLGVYSVAVTVALMPTSVWMRVASMLALPALARAQGERERFERLYRACQQTLTLLSVGMAVFLIVAGPKAVVLLFGQKYAGTAAVLAWLSVMQTLRMMRVGPTIVALARGDSMNSLMANVGRATAVPMALGAAILGADLWWMAIAGAVGEVVSLGTAVVLLKHRHAFAMRMTLWPVAFYGVFVGLAACAVAMGAASAGWVVVLGVSAGLSGAAAGAMLVVFKELRRSAGLSGA